MLPPRRFKHFLNDKDGLSMKDYLMLISSIVFFLFITVGLILVLVEHEVDPMYIDLLDTLSPVIMTITGGVFGVTAVETFKRREKPEKETSENDYDYLMREDEY